MTTKELFIEKNPELAAYLRDIAKSTQFQLALVPVDSEVFQHSTGPEFIAGARFYKQTLLTLANPEEPEAPGQAQPGWIEAPFSNSVTAKQETQPKA